MIASICRVLATTVVLAFATKPVLAHHAFAAVFDAKQPIKLTGTVTGGVETARQR